MPLQNDPVQAHAAWSQAAARQVYNLANWTEGYFDIDPDGHLAACLLDQSDYSGVSLYALATALKDAGLGPPVLVRFQHILRDRVNQLCKAFDRTMRECRYNGRYTAVYPIKVNQQRSVIEQILRAGQGRVGLEAGSKPELLAVLALTEGADGIVICNGYKDTEYVRLALIGRLLGSCVYIVVEKPSELETVIRESRALGVKPLLGLRTRLASIGAGKWQNTGGEKAKFGLSAAQIVALIQRLKDESMLDCLQLLHFHMGSQIANIGDINRGMREAGRYYADLYTAGAPISIVDVGGGLGVDYEGTRSHAYCSMNYTLREYAGTVVRALNDVCDERRLPHPDIITEAGRAMTAHHAVLITNVIDAEYAPAGDISHPPRGAEAPVLRELWRLYEHQDELSIGEIYNEAQYWLTEAQSMYTHGVLDLAGRVRAEQLYHAVCRRLMQRLDAQPEPPQKIAAALHEKFADKYFCNFSVFQSAPDVWAIEQIFPIVPLHRLNERPTRRAVLQDLTCDSDGQIRAYVDSGRIQATLPVHDYRPGETYLLGLFLVGAYQEILGDQHNLFGDTHAVNVQLLSDGGYQLETPEYGDKVEELLRFVHFDAERLMAAYRVKINAADINVERRSALLQELEAGLHGYTYLED
ncbi:MAG TPA: biosynthetic arginine decarboxylase [Gammaproteobacteria bacterium]|nr:biosynthetic arginine decarboxylase [Gammaproteobacteria bacterium]